MTGFYMKRNMSYCILETNGKQMVNWARIGLIAIKTPSIISWEKFYTMFGDVYRFLSVYRLPSIFESYLNIRQEFS